MPDLYWHREGYSQWTEPETWLYTTDLFGGTVYAKVVYDPPTRRWHWLVQSAISTGFHDRGDAQHQAEAYVRTHPDLLAMNR